MNLADIVKLRRSHYSINKDIGNIADSEIIKMVEELTYHNPDAYNMQSARIAIALGEKHNKLWDTIYEVFNGKVKREKIDTFKSGYGTILFYIEENTVKSVQEKFPKYAENFGLWSNQSNGMLQYAVWLGLREKNLGASLQHYNPVIDQRINKLFDIPDGWKLLAQMPFGGIAKGEEPKEKISISERVIVL